jgi:asparagine synthase (glutamine-hydrolysing)
MCGICGELAFGGAPVSLEPVRAMADAIAHRGPDDSGYYIEGSIGLGHRRLSIIDLSQLGHQPLWNHDRTVAIVLNGEIYNYREIARELESRGVAFRGGSDTEVLVNAVSVWGVEEAVRRLIGMFAFAVWDTRAQRLTLVRDRAGIKPLFYWSDARRVLFGSETRALMAHPAFEKAIDPRGLGQFFVTGFTLGDTTALRNVKRVLPGHIVSVDRDGNWTDTEYWNIDAVARSRGEVNLDEAADELEELLESAIGYRLVADVPVTNFLSGGIDSSLVAAVLQRKLGADLQHITVGFREAEFDESAKAKRVAEALGLRHSVHYVDTAEAQAGLERFVEVYDEPFGDTSGIPTHILSRIARQEATVALSADGGDEQFCGYESYARYRSAWNRMDPVPASLRRAAVGVGRRLPLRALAGIASGDRDTTLRPQTYARMQKALRIGGARSTGELVRIMFEKAWTWDEPMPFAGAPRGLFDRTVLSDAAIAADDDELLGSMMRTDYRTFLRDDVLTKVDRASMHVSLEARDPLLDHRIAEFAYRLPLSAVYAGGEHKRLLKKLVRRWIPEDVVTSPKRGFSIPLYRWMRTIWKPTVMEHLSPAAVKQVGVLDPRVVEREVRQFYAHAGASAERIWMLMSFQMWARRWL